jgi:excinuclease UvrABC ATPase subunit
MDTPIKDLTKEQYTLLLYGTGEEKYEIHRWFGKQDHHQLAKFEGIVPMIENRMQMYGNEYYNR